MLKTAMIFTDKMVLQRGKKIPVWGSIEAGEEVCVYFDGVCVTGCGNKNGAWMVELPSHEAGTGFEMKITSKAEEIVYTDVCVGDVWLAGGQSNMEYLLGFEKHFDEVLLQEKNLEIRFFDYPEVCYEGQMDDFDYKYEGFWRACTKEDLGYFSAVGFYFAESIQKATGIPIGIVGCNWGGTTACAWMDPERLMGTEGEFWIHDFEEAQKGLDVEEYKKNFVKNPANDRTNELWNPERIQVVKIGLSREEQLEVMKQEENGFQVVIGPYYERRPGGLYETMLKKVWPYAICGAIWYQGESDSDKYPEAYTTVFSRMIENWRDLWGEEFPFLFVQLAPFGNWLMCDGLRYPIIRACQEKVSKTVKNTWMASIGDVGMKWDIHPKDKKTVGNRLALLARGHVYGEEILCDAPELVSAKKEGEDVILTFAFSDGLHMKGEKLSAMYGMKTGGEICELTDAEIVDGRLIVHNCREVIELQFASCDYYVVNIYNAAEIPVKPFVVSL